MAEHEQVSPWEPGHHEDQSVFTLQVQICERRPEGLRQIDSRHDFLTAGDKAVARKLMSLGEEQIAFGLLQEAMRRECYLEVLLNEQHAAGFLENYKNSSEEDQRHQEQVFATRLSTILTRTVTKMAPDIVREILEMVTAENQPSG